MIFVCIQVVVAGTKKNIQLLMQHQRQPKRHDEGKLFISKSLKILVCLAASIFQSVNTIRGNDFFPMQYISHYRSNLVKDVH